LGHDCIQFLKEKNKKLEMSFKILEDEKNQKILHQQLEIDQLTEKL